MGNWGINIGNGTQEILHTSQLLYHWAISSAHYLLMIAVISSSRYLRALIPYIEGLLWVCIFPLSEVKFHSFLPTSWNNSLPAATPDKTCCFLYLVTVEESLNFLVLWETESFLSFAKFCQEVDVFLPQPSLYYIAQNRYLLFLWLFFAILFHFL